MSVHSHVPKFVDHSMRLDGVESTRKVNKEDSDRCFGRVEVRKDLVEKGENCVFCTQSLLVGELVGVSVLGDIFQEGFQNQLFKDFHDKGGQGYRPVVVHAGRSLFLGYWSDDRFLPD